MLPKGQYNPGETEKEILNFWMENNFYKPEYDGKTGRIQTEEEFLNDPRETFTIICPPPNANGNLHLGHMSGYAYQDLMGRYNRMRGKRVLLLPGKDHAGIQTEVVFEEELRNKGIDKKTLGREEFYKQCYDFCIEKAANARSQEKNIGLSADFDRELFTLDPRIVENVMNAFKLMYEDGLIYRGKRLINWCPRCQSALADIDTEFKDSVGKFFYFKYGFLQPESKAIEIKNNYQGKTIKWNFERNKTKDGKDDLPFAYGHTKGESNLEVIGIGFNGNEEEFSGKVIGIQMRLDNNFRLVVIKEDFSGDINSEINKTFLFEIKYYAGAHIILFDDYPEDKFYTNGFILATVRPETIFGDTGIAVDPDDNRYAEYVSKEYEVLTIDGTVKLKIVADNSVEESFGSGMVKVTPAHAFEDWDIAQRHPELMPEKQVIDFFGKLNHMAGKYEGMKVKEARNAMIDDMRTIGMLVYLNENYENRLRICERCKHPIEPLISHQWFVDTKPLKEKAKRLVEEGLTEIMPEGNKKMYIDWMNNPEDWCITRQLWWGYRIPVWYSGVREEYVTETGEVREKINGQVVENKNDYAKLLKVEIQKPEGDNWIQDADVLDTWFSSGQWPFLTLKAKENDFDKFYPSQVMETGWDILIFWVSRMMLLNPYRAEKDGITDEKKQIPFSNVYLHGLVLDKNGVKMSKSKGNGIDPFEMMNKYGTDALRFSFIVGNAVGQNYRLYEEKIESYKNFCNKIWNASRFVLMNLEGVEAKTIIESEIKEDSNKEIYSHIVSVKEKITKLLDEFKFGIAAQELYENFWHIFCDQQIETSKQHLYVFKDKETGAITSEPKPGAKEETQQILLFTLKEYLKMLHPFIPFITDRIWQEVAKNEDDHKSLMYTGWS